jgi:NAD(P)-dependent dehydrogenase (short-subunit alcohol dehydrogenase family)
MAVLTRIPSASAVPQMRELGHGSIINMSSVSWMRGIPQLEAYAAAKAAIVGFTNTLARAVGPSRIRVNAIAPGMVLTERQRRLWFQDERQIEATRDQQCLPDPIVAEDIANPVAACPGSPAPRGCAAKMGI